VRLAELTSSMFWAAPVTAILTPGVAISLSVDPSTQPPERLAFLFGMSLLGTWAALVPAKLLEGRTLSPAGRRLLNLGIGLVLGLLGALLVSWIQVGIAPERGYTLVEADPTLTSLFQTSTEITPLTYAGYFGLLSLLAGSPWLAARDRKKRFRVFSVLKTGAAAAILGLVLPFPQPWGIGIAAVTAVVTQAVSPWSKPAAAYALYAAKAAKAAKRGRKIA
jgi:hypothetical protein